MYQDRPLKWVQANREKKDRVRRVGPLIERLVEQRAVPGVAAAQEAASAIAAVVDDEFRSHCRVAVVREKMLVVNVDSASLVCAMRMRWLSALLRTLSSPVGGRWIDRIVFEFGTAGVLVEQLAGGRVK